LGEPALDPIEILERLKSEHQVLRWEPLPPDEVPSPRNDQTRVRSSLEYLHHHWALPDQFDPQESGRGLRARLMLLVGRLTYRVLGPYFREERQLLSHLVQVSEALQQRCDYLTLRCEELNREMIERQVAEAENQSKLALWLHLAPPAATKSDRSDDVSAPQPSRSR
jgi:hypothetical protein